MYACEQKWNAIVNCAVHEQFPNQSFSPKSRGKVFCAYSFPLCRIFDGESIEFLFIRINSRVKRLLMHRDIFGEIFFFWNRIFRSFLEEKSGNLEQVIIIMGTSK